MNDATKKKEIFFFGDEDMPPWQVQTTVVSWVSPNPDPFPLLRRIP